MQSENSRVFEASHRYIILTSLLLGNVGLSALDQPVRQSRSYCKNDHGGCKLQQCCERASHYTLIEKMASISSSKQANSSSNSKYEQTLNYVLKAAVNCACHVMLYKKL